MIRRGAYLETVRALLERDRGARLAPKDERRRCTRCSRCRRCGSLCGRPMGAPDVPRCSRCRACSRCRKPGRRAGGRVPFGYRVVAPQLWRLDRPAAAQVRELFRRVAEGERVPLAAAAVGLSARRAGDLLSRSVYATGAHGARRIVDEGTWRAAVARLAARRLAWPSSC